MRKDLQLRQEQMRLRVPGAGPQPNPARVWNPIDYSTPVEYGSEVRALIYSPRFNGTYLLTEGGRFYVGQSTDVQARFSSHRVKPVCCDFTDPRGALLATVPEYEKTWNDNTRIRLNAEARFIAAALSLDIPLTNKLSTRKRAKLAGMFSDLDQERARIEEALKILC